ncbi:MAG: hypothetical protein Q9222_004788 [Ikaeria aurantiellina]
MDVQTRVFADGRWTTRTLNIHQILALNREGRAAMPEISNGPNPPALGLLTRTLVRSPAVKSIIPARVRHRHKNDVVFVYDDGILIKEIVGGERIEEHPFSDIFLDDVVLKRDFDSSILAAKVFGLPREPKVARFPGKFWNKDATPSIAQSPPDIKPETLHENEIPPQILVLSLASHRIVFLFAYYNVPGDVRFLSSTWPLPLHLSPSEELGIHLAVDPKSRSMAVGAFENQVVIYSLKSMEDMRNEVPSNGRLEAANFMPIKEEKHVRVDGLILNMEYLHPSKGDEYHVILLLLISKRDKRRFVRIEWDSRSGLTEFKRYPGQALALSGRLPLLLIPLTYGTAFAVVCERQIVVYSDILTGNARGQTCELEIYGRPEEFTGSSKSPTWTQWARPMRPREGRHPVTDNIYLCREDGVIRYIDFREDTNPMISTNYEAGVLQANLGHAFAALDLGNESNDLLVAAGELGDGGMWYFNPRQPLDHIGTIRNWAPLRATVSARIPQSTEQSSRDETNATVSNERLFACSGRGPRNGTITNIRFGTEASKLGSTIDLSELAHEAALNMWTLPDRSDFGIYLMMTHPTGTEMILLPSSDNQEPQALSEIEDLDLNVRTIVAGCTGEGFIIQVTSAAINAIAQERGILPFTLKIDGAITTACLLTIPGMFTVLLTVVLQREEFYLHQRIFASQDGQIASEKRGEPLLLRSEVSTMSVQWVGDSVVVFVGTLGTLQCYMALYGSGIAPYFEYDFADKNSFCESLAMITNEEAAGVKERHLILCGHRDGTVDILHFNGPSVDKDILVLGAHIQIGYTPVKVITDTTRRSRAIVACEDILCTIECPGDSSLNLPISLNRLWLTDPGLPSFQQSSVSCFTQADSIIPRGYSKYAAGSLFYLSGSTLLLADISPSPELQMVPRQLPVNGAPFKVIYSGRLKRLVVIYLRPSTDLSKQTAERRDKPQQKTPRYALAFVDPDAETFASMSVLDEVDGFTERHGERFHDVIEWFPSDTDRGMQYHVFVVTTAIAQTTTQQATGRLLLFKPILDGADKLTVKLKKRIDLDGPVWSVAPYGDSSLVYACGDDIVLQTLDMSSMKFKQATKVRLGSPGRYISVQGTDVHVSTGSAGYQNFKIDDDRLVPQFADVSDRCGVHHLAIPETSVVLVADLECRIAGLWLPPHPRLDRTAPLLFEASLLQPITRLCKVKRPIWSTTSSSMDEDGIIGTTEDGSIYQLTLLDEPVWRFLAFIQNMAKRDPRICPYPHPREHERHIEPSMAKKRYMHIDGDILIRLIERGGASLLRHLLSKEPDSEHASLQQDLLLQEPDVDNRLSDFASAGAREERFWELAKDVKDWTPARDLEGVMEWLHTMLMPVL